MNQIKKSDDLAVMSIGKPYDIKYFHDAKTVLMAYAYIGMDPTDAGNLEITKEFGPNIPAAIEVCLGAADAKGILPINIL